MAEFSQVVGIGNAIIDIFAFVDEIFLEENKIKKGVMNLISSERAKILLGKIEISKKVAGGSAANTMVGLSQLGIKTSYMGKVFNDKLGKFFVDDLNSNKVKFESYQNSSQLKLCTGHCIVLITPDGERTMNTHLGITEYLSKEDLDVKTLKNCAWLYLEGYRYDGFESQRAFSIAIEHTKLAGGKIALSLSDPFCVERHRSKFLKIIHDDVDIIFCNEKELMSLTGKKDLNAALMKSEEFSCKVVCTVAEDGVFIQNLGSCFHVPTKEVNIKDTTGAGDLFATGFLYGVLAGLGEHKSGQFGNKCAGEVIQILGCRLKEEKLLTLLR